MSLTYSTTPLSISSKDPKLQRSTVCRVCRALIFPSCPIFPTVILITRAPTLTDCLRSRRVWDRHLSCFFPPPHLRLSEPRLTIEISTILKCSPSQTFARQGLHHPPVSSLTRLRPALAGSSPSPSPSPPPRLRLLPHFHPHSVPQRCLGGTESFPGRPTSSRGNRYVSECCFPHVPDRNRPIPAYPRTNGVQCPPVYLSVHLYCSAQALLCRLTCSPSLPFSPETGCASSLYSLPVRNSKPSAVSPLPQARTGSC